MTPECSELSDILHKESIAIASASNDSSWAAVESAARALGDALRIKDGPDNHTALGKTNLPTDLNNLLASALAQHLPNGSITTATFELMRVGANMCMDHDGNREQLQDSGFLMSVVKVLEHYAETIPSISKQTAPLPLCIPQLKVVKTAIGVLLNATIGYEPVRSRLMALEAAITILRLSTSIYPPGRWASVEAPLSPEDPTTNEALVESWNIRSGLSGWSWRFISELKGGDDGEEEAAAKSPNPQPLLGPDGLPLLIRQLSAFIPPYPHPRGPYTEPASRRHLVAADAECLEEACTLLEALCLDAEDIRLSFARGLSFPDGEHGGVKCIEELCNFLERGDYPVYWSDESEQEQARRKKTFDFCKAALVKALVEVAGEDKNTDVLWDNSEAEKPGGAFVWAMVSWIRGNKVLGASGRDDLIICATLCLGNIARREAHSAALLQPPISLATDLADLLQPDADLKVKHGVIGLLKHLAQATTNRPSLGKAGILPRLATSGIWGEKADMAEIIQVSAIGVAKHLCNGNAENVYELVLAKADDESQATALAQILALIRRSDSVPVKSEGTRVLVNAIKSVWSPDAAKGTQRSEAMAALLDSQCATALAQMVARSKKYPILINEGVVALTLLSTHAKGGTVVFTALTSQLPEEAAPRGASIVEPAEAEPTSESSPVTALTSALDGLYMTLKNRDGKIAPEVRANICALLGQLGRDGVVDNSESEEVAKLKEKVRPLLEEAARTEKNSRGNAALVTAANSALQAWKSSSDA